MRRILDIEGREWRVREVSPAAYDRRSAGSLVFEAVDMARRVREYPADWFTRPDEFLLDLNEHPMRRRSDDCW